MQKLKQSKSAKVKEAGANCIIEKVRLTQNVTAGG